MNRLAFVFCLLLLLFAGIANGAAYDAVVRVPSHGGSGTIVATGRGWTLILSCAHMLEGSRRHKPIELDAPTTQAGPARHAGIRVVAVDYDADLSMIQLDAGPMHNVCAVATIQHRPGGNILSAGYDSMRDITVRKATILGTDGSTTFTREIPWHGRSGGALIDADAGLLLGVVQGYEVDGARRGRYISLQTIHTFVARNSFVRGQRAPPQVYEYRYYGNMNLPPQIAPGDC